MASRPTKHGAAEHGSAQHEGKRGAARIGGPQPTSPPTHRGNASITAQDVEALFRSVRRRGAMPTQRQCEQISAWVTLWVPDLLTGRLLTQAATPADRLGKAARELRAALDFELAPGVILPDGTKVEYRWADGASWHPAADEPELRALAAALDAAWPRIAPRRRGPSRTGINAAVREVFACYQSIIGGGSASKDGEAVRFVKAILAHMGLQGLAVGAIEQSLRRSGTAPSSCRTTTESGAG